MPQLRSNKLYNINKILKFTLESSIDIYGKFKLEIKKWTKIWIINIRNYNNLFFKLLIDNF